MKKPMDSSVFAAAVGFVRTALDWMAFSALVWIAAFLPVRRSERAVWIASLIAFGACGIVFFSVRRKRQRERERQRAEAERALIAERLLLLPQGEIAAALGTDAFIRKYRIGVDDLLPLLRAGKTEIWLCGMPDADLSAWMNAHAETIEIHPLSETVRFFPELAGDGTAVPKQPRRMPTLSEWKEAIRRMTPNRFTLLGILLTVLSFLTGFRLYYRLLASVSFLLGALVYTARRLRARADGIVI